MCNKILKKFNRKFTINAFLAFFGQSKIDKFFKSSAKISLETFKCKIQYLYLS